MAKAMAKPRAKRYAAGGASSVSSQMRAPTVAAPTPAAPPPPVANPRAAEVGFGRPQAAVNIGRTGITAPVVAASAPRIRPATTAAAVRPATFAKGGEVRGVGIAKKGFRPCKVR